MRNLLIFVMIVGLFSLSAAEYDRIMADMNDILDKNPNHAQMFDIGKNDQGNTIYGLRIENPNIQIKTGKLQHLLVGTHHGNERKSAYLSMTFARALLVAMQNSDHKYYNSLSRCVFYVVPVLNIGGFNANRRSERDQYGSYLDPNRDYPDACVKNSYFRLASIRNLVDFVERQNIVGAVTVHGYIGTFTYPWGIYTDTPKTNDDSFFRSIATEAVKSNNYRTGTHTEVIYPAAGAFEDWAYHKHGIWTMLLELSYSANLENDSQAVLTFFAMVPAEKSTKNQHTGNCTQDRSGDINSRP